MSSCTKRVVYKVRDFDKRRHPMTPRDAFEVYMYNFLYISDSKYSRYIPVYLRECEAYRCLTSKEFSKL